MVLDVPAVVAAQPAQAKIPLLLRMLVLPFVQKIMVFCLCAIGITLDESRVEIAHEVWHMVCI